MMFTIEKEVSAMRFLSVFKAPEGAPPTEKEAAEMGALIGEMAAAGVLLAAEGCLPSSRGARVRLSKGTFTVTDGPFTESKELIGGFAIIQTSSMSEAVEWTKRFIQVAGDGETEIRELYDAPAFAKS